MKLGNLVLWIAIMSLLLVTPAMRGGGQPLLAQQPAGEGAASTETAAAAEVAGPG